MANVVFRFLIFLFLVSFSFVSYSQEKNPDPRDWESVLSEAKGQVVYWNAWGGSQKYNDYMAWSGSELSRLYGVEVRHVKLEDTAHAIASVLAQKQVGQDSDGRVDLIWINGENFASMKRQDLLMSPDWVSHLPNWRYVDHENKPSILVDFTIPTDGLEAPWGGAKLVFFHDTARTKTSDMPDSTTELLSWVKSNKGRFSYPSPPDFIGSSFLKQILIEQVSDREKLLEPVVASEFGKITEPLFSFLDELHPHLWRGGRTFPKNLPALLQMLGDNELDIIFAFNPAEASSAIAQDKLPDTVRSFTFSGGTLGNTHFVAIPYNANAKAGALVLANFLMSPEAQLRKQDPEIWGDPTILSMSKVPKNYSDAFASLDLGIATLSPADLGPILLEPHPSWVEAIEKEWKSRYASGE